MLGRGGILVGALLSLTASDVAAAEREHVLPDHDAHRAHRQSAWLGEGSWRVSPPRRTETTGSRVAAMASVSDGARSIHLQARGVALDAEGSCDATAGAGPWVPMEETFTGAVRRVEIADLDAKYPCAQLRIAAADDVAVDGLLWELLEPRYPDAGRRSRDLVAPSQPLTAIPPELETLGVITREAWGARATQCSSTEDDWYRMAIHHTAGPQTSNGSVAEELRATQAYGMDSGGYCDIPYQMLVGYDGSLYEGRGLALFSGATGGNNTGNLAICFIGCYHAPDSDCVGGVGHDPSDAMMLRGQLLVQTLAELEQIPTTEDDIRGHRDWPGNATACPGSLLHPRLGEFREDLAWFAASEVARSWEAEVEVPVGGSQEIWIELENTGGLPWLPGVTYLAPTEPRDSESPLYDASWPTTQRAATVDAEVQPGEIGRFSLRVSLSSEDTVTQTFGLVHDGTTWFSDAPWGGGPTDDAVSLTVRGVIPVGTTGGDGGSSTGGQHGTGGEGEGSSTGDVGESSGAGGGMALPRHSEGGDEGCGCRSGQGGPGLMLLGLFGLFSRRSWRTSTRSDRRARPGCPSRGRGRARRPPPCAPSA